MTEVPDLGQQLCVLKCAVNITASKAAVTLTLNAALPFI